MGRRRGRKCGPAAGISTPLPLLSVEWNPGGVALVQEASESQVRRGRIDPRHSRIDRQASSIRLHDYSSRVADFVFGEANDIDGDLEYERALQIIGCRQGSF